MYVAQIAVLGVNCGISNTIVLEIPGDSLCWLSQRDMGQHRVYSTCLSWPNYYLPIIHDDVIKWKHFPRNWLFVRGIHRSPVNSPHKGHWRGALMFSLICAWVNGWASNGEAGDLRRHRAHYDVTVMYRVLWCFVVVWLWSILAIYCF